MRHTVVAVNFGDLELLKQATCVALRHLADLSAEDKRATVAFRWTDTTWSMTIEPKTERYRQQHDQLTPKGVSTSAWARLVALELGNHLLNGGRFTMEHVNAEAGDRSLVLDLVRA